MEQPILDNVNPGGFPGAPVVYGGFTSNVDMKSGSPAFGTPEYVKACFGTGHNAPSTFQKSSSWSENEFMAPATV